MPRRRGRERARAQGARLGQSIRSARGIAGLSRDEAARRAGLAGSTWTRLEAGSPSATLTTIAAAAEAVGLDLVCQTYPGHGPSLRDSGQLALAERLRAIASPEWRVALEEPAGDHGEATDVVFRGSTEIIAIEIERLILDWQGQYRRASTKRAWLAERTGVPVRLVIVIADTARNRAAMAMHLPLIRTVVPIGSRAVLSAIRSGEPLGGDGMCWIRRSRSADR
jgi:transcriptional regulator with XRE-family HTH domain